MWNWLNCYLSGRHEFGITCEPGTVFLRCIHCGKRSPGWALEGPAGKLTPVKAQSESQPERTRKALPFTARRVRLVKSA
jgi:hypothetical protein